MLPDMSKYAPLIAYLKRTTSESLLLSFDDIRKIIGAELPKTAKTDRGWWANTQKNTHVWAHEWVSAGWKASVTIANGTVTFSRFNYVPMPLLDALLPYERRTVMSLVEEAGISVEKWKKSGGRLLDQPQSNPAFCYDWCFGTDAEGYVLCAWHKGLTEEHGQVVFRCDIGSHTRKLSKALERIKLTATQRTRLKQQRERSEVFEEAVTHAYHSGAGLRLILNLGDTRECDELEEQAASVSERRLDAERWYVHLLKNGDAVIVRGVPRADLQDTEGSHSEPPSDPGEDDRWREGQIQVRRGQPEFRHKLMACYEVQCAVTRTSMPGLLEAAHIIPHAEGSDYRVSNGLLLRADIHTLYDLHHLSIDEHGVVHLSDEVRNLKEYAGLDQKTIRQTKSIMDAPSPTNLASRHARFLTCESQRVRQKTNQ
jgi:hypothetical protein